MNSVDILKTSHHYFYKKHGHKEGEFAFWSWELKGDEDKV